MLLIPGIIHRRTWNYVDCLMRMWVNFKRSQEEYCLQTCLLWGHNQRWKVHLHFLPMNKIAAKLLNILFWWRRLEPEFAQWWLRSTAALSSSQMSILRFHTVLIKYLPKAAAGKTQKRVDLKTLTGCILALPPTSSPQRRLLYMRSVEMFSFRAFIQIH